MEEQQCRKVATEPADLRCSGLLGSARIEVEDGRYKSFHRFVEIEPEDARFNGASVPFQDPQGEGLALRW